MKETKQTMSGKRNIAYVQNEEPSFIKAFKQKTGYKEDDTVDAKRAELKYEEDDRSDTEEEKPTVVVLREGHLTADEVDQLKNIKHKVDEDEEPADGRITFKKPTKRKSEDTSELHVSSSNKNKEKKSEKKSSSSKKVKNTKLLSFDDEEEDT